MRRRSEKTIDKKTYSYIMGNIPPKFYIICAKCKATKIDVPELCNFLMEYTEKYLYCDDFNLEKNAEIMDTILMDILEDEPYGLDNTSFTKWRIQNKERLFGRLHEEGELEYFSYDYVVFYHNCKCDCYLSKKVDQDKTFRVRVE